MHNRNNQLSQLDVNQMQQRMYQEESDAQRVVIVGQDMSSVAESIKEAVKEGLKNISIDLPKQEQPLVIEKQVIVKEPMVIQTERIIEIPVIKEIEKIVIVKEYEVIEKPITIIQPQIVTIEKPIFMDRIKPGIPGWFSFLFLCQSVILISLLINFLTRGH